MWRTLCATKSCAFPCAAMSMYVPIALFVSAVVTTVAHLFTNDPQFINGQNGSGKSAILAAIQICLGAGARRTHRARNIKDLVRKDGNVTGAKVQVTLLNGGGDGYKQDIYGQTITVERQISLNGGYNGYKLLDENMKERSRSKKDLDEMLDTL